MISVFCGRIIGFDLISPVFILLVTYPFAYYLTQVLTTV